MENQTRDMGCDKTKPYWVWGGEVCQTTLIICAGSENPFDWTRVMSRLSMESCVDPRRWTRYVTRCGNTA